jgi:hypothetical protein
MSSKLKAITTKAKALYKSGKYSKWTDAIKAASKSIGATKKKAAPKKKAAVKKKTAPKKKAAVKSVHKDTKSHNVKINVTSGIGAVKSAGLKHLKDKYGKLCASKLSVTTKKGKKEISKEIAHVARQIKKLHTL